MMKKILLPAILLCVNITIIQAQKNTDAKRNKMRGEEKVEKAESSLFRWFFGLDAKKPKKFYIAPTLGWNKYDLSTIGLSFHTTPVTAEKFEIVAAPMFSFGSKALNGMAEMRYNFGKSAAGANLKSFHFFCETKGDTLLTDRFLKITPYADIAIGEKGKIELRSLLINRHFEEADSNSFRAVNRLNYRWENGNKDAPSYFRAGLENAFYKSYSGSENYLKIELEGKFRFLYQERHGVNLRFFGGFMALNSKDQFNPFPFRLIGTAANDYNYDNFVFRRAEDGVGSPTDYNANKFGAKQITENDGGFKVPIESLYGGGSFNGSIEPTSTQVMLSVNLSGEIPINLPIRFKFFKIKPYIDFAYFRGYDSSKGEFVNSGAYSGGMMVDIGQGAGGLYFPAFNSKTLATNLKLNGNYFQRIAFFLDLNKMNPFKKLRKKK